jgi:hypothetical protein
MNMNTMLAIARKAIALTIITFISFALAGVVVGPQEASNQMPEQTSATAFVCARVVN